MQTGHGAVPGFHAQSPLPLLIFLMTPVLAALVQARTSIGRMTWLVMLLPLVFSRPEFEQGVDQTYSVTFNTQEMTYAFEQAR